MRGFVFLVTGMSGGFFERGREMSVSITDMEFSNSSSSVNRFSVRTLFRYVRFYIWFNDILFPQKLKKEDPILCSTHSSTLTYILAKEDNSRTIQGYRKRRTGFETAIT